MPIRLQRKIGEKGDWGTGKGRKVNGFRSGSGYTHVDPSLLTPIPPFPGSLAQPVRRAANMNMRAGCHARHSSAKGEKRNALALQVTD